MIGCCVTACCSLLLLVAVRCLLLSVKKLYTARGMWYHKSKCLQSVRGCSLANSETGLQRRDKIVHKGGRTGCRSVFVKNAGKCPGLLFTGISTDE